MADRGIHTPHTQTAYSESCSPNSAIEISHPHNLQQDGDTDSSRNIIKSVHVINNDLKSHFQGKSAGPSSAKIRWFANRKSQILGFCLFVASLGMTIAFSGQRVAGLIIGSVFAFLCGIAVIWTYRKKRQWHQHPNPIVYMRSILGTCFAICLLLNIFINTDELFPPSSASGSSNKGGISQNCKNLAGITEFFLITSELWGLMMAVDLFFSLTSPFTDYRHLVRTYHCWVWSIGLAMAISTYAIPNAAGFFRVDGQVLDNEAKNNHETLVGFCLAASRIVNDDIQGDSSSSFFKAQTWPWVLVYSVIVIVLIISVTVLILAWHRLYLRGMPKTYSIRLRVLNYVSFFTGAYVFYWLLLLLVYMAAYFISSAKTHEPYKWLSQMLRQVVMFLISSKGYVDYVIWFAVNSIDWKTPGQLLSRRSNDDADLDVDLSPQVNTALRAEILYYTTSGITRSVRDFHKLPADQRKREVFLVNTGESIDRNSHEGKMKFWSYCPQTFRKVREFFGICDSEYVKLFSATTKERFSEGRSGAFMFFTADESLIVKTMSKEECLFLREMASNYAEYLMAHPRSFLTRFYGCHAVRLYGKTYYFVVMGNLFADTGTLHYRYDIKGSWVDRNAKHPKIGDKVHCRYCNASYSFGSKRNVECDGYNLHEPNIVLKDNDLMTKIRIDRTAAEKIYHQLCADSDFLSKQGIMDYSLLMGVQSCEYAVGSKDIQILQDGGRSSLNQDSTSNYRTQLATSVNGPAMYHFGVIDFLQQWTLSKRLERFYKVNILQRDGDGVSAIAPKSYLIRFQQKMAQIFGIDPTKLKGEIRTNKNFNVHPDLTSGNYMCHNTQPGMEDPDLIFEESVHL